MGEAGLRHDFEPRGLSMNAGSHVIRNREKIAEIVELLVSKRTEINVRLQGQKKPFTSKLIKLFTGTGEDMGASTLGKRVQLILEKLAPEQGNELILSSPDLVIEFSVGDRVLGFDTRYAGISSNYPYFGIIVEFPDSLRVGDTRREERFTPDIPEFVYVEFDLGKGPDRKGRHRLNVINYSSHGLGLLVTEKNFGLLQLLEVGDKIKDVTFFAKWAIIKVDATVRHKTRIKEGKHKGQYIIGVESSELLDIGEQPGTAAGAP